MANPELENHVPDERFKAAHDSATRLADLMCEIAPIIKFAASSDQCQKIGRAMLIEQTRQRREIGLPPIS